MIGNNAFPQIQRNEAEASVAIAVAKCVTDIIEGEWEDREWVHLFVDIEIDDSGERSNSISFVLARHPRQSIEKISFRLSLDAKRRFADLARSMDAQDRWTCAQLRMERDGRYSLHYVYAPPYRLGGHLLDTRFRDYLEKWLESEEGAAFQRRSRAWWQRWFSR